MTPNSPSACDPLDPRRLEDPALPRGLAGHLAADLLDDRHGLVDVGAIGDGHVLVDARPHPGQVGRHLDLAVGDGVDDAVEVAQRRAPEREVLDRARDARDAHDVALRELVLDEDVGAIEVVADHVLRPEPDCDADDAKAGHGGPDVEAQPAHHHQAGDDDDEEPQGVAEQGLERVHPLLELDGAQLLGRPLEGLAIQQGLDDAVDEHVGEAHGDERDDDDEHDRQDVFLDERKERVPLLVGDVGHGRSLPGGSGGGPLVSRGGKTEPSRIVRSPSGCESSIVMGTGGLLGQSAPPAISLTVTVTVTACSS